MGVTQRAKWKWPLQCSNNHMIFHTVFTLALQVQHSQAYHMSCLLRILLRVFWLTQNQQFSTSRCQVPWIAAKDFQAWCLYVQFPTHDNTWWLQWSPSLLLWLLPLKRIPSRVFNQTILHPTLIPWQGTSASHPQTRQSTWQHLDGQLTSISQSQSALPLYPRHSSSSYSIP